MLYINRGLPNLKLKGGGNGLLPQDTVQIDALKTVTKI